MSSPDPGPTGRLTLGDSELRELGRQVVDLVADHWRDLGQEPPIRVGRPDELQARLCGPPPEHATPPTSVIDELMTDVLPYVQHGDHPRFFARIPGPSNPLGAVADFLAAGLNLFVGSWTGGSGPAALELVVLDWLRDMLGLPEGSEGAFVSGGSVATLNALAAARTRVLAGDGAGAVVYASDQAHAAVARALAVLGFARDQLHVVPVDAALRLDPQALRAMVAADRRAGRRPFCVVATAGTTNTGAVDPLAEIAQLCRDEELWLHVDAAYGGPAVLSTRGRALLAGVGQADSIAVDPHKWLFQPYECGVVIVRHPGALTDAFALHPEYLADVAGHDGQVNFFDRGLQLTRGSRALKLWLTIKSFGLAEIRSAIDRGIDLAEEAEALLRQRAWRIVTPAQLGIVSFDRDADGAPPAALDAMHLGVVSELQAGGVAAVSSTVLRGRVVLRMCTINPRTTTDDLVRTVREVERAWEAVARRQRSG